MSKWEYGGAYERYPIPPEGWKFDDGSTVKVHNIFDPLPAFVKKADLLFIDPPWNLGNLNTFYTKAGRTDYQDSFEKFYKRLFECIREIDPHTCYVEIGKQHLAEFIMEMKSIFRHVTFYNSMYYRKKENMCYVICGSQKRKRKQFLDYMDEEEIIKWICENENYDIIGDLCMGRGLVGWYAYKAGRKFVGTELNEKRLSVLVERIEADKEFSKAWE